jgi:nicotinamide-nucleotide amidase
MIDLKELFVREPRLWLAVAESLTSGRVQARIAEKSGASDFFAGGITAYNIDQKVKHLGVNRAAAKKVNCVSAEIAEQMAVGVCKLFGSDIGLATTGYAEPAPDLDRTHPFAWWAIAHRGKRGKFSVLSGRVECPGASRTQAQAIVADAALTELEAFVRALRKR